MFIEPGRALSDVAALGRRWPAVHSLRSLGDLVAMFLRKGRQERGRLGNSTVLLHGRRRRHRAPGETPGLRGMVVGRAIPQLVSMQGAVYNRLDRMPATAALG